MLRDRLYSTLIFLPVRFMKQLIPLIFICLLPFQDVLAQQDIGSGLDFLNIGPSSRLLSISEATTAAQTGPSAIYTNPSLLAWEERSSLDANYTLWISEVDNQFAAINFVQDRYAYAFGVYSSRADGFEARDRPGPSAGNFSINYLSISGALAYRFGPISAGITGQFLREEVFQFRANGFAANLGVSAKFLNNRIITGLSVNNIGNMESLDEVSTTLPTTLNIGLSADVIEFTTPGENDLPVLVTLLADWSKPIEDNPTSDFIGADGDESFFSIAMSADVGDLIFIQSGYRFGPTERPLSFGAGIFVEPIRINYAVVPFSTGFGTVHSIGLEYYF